MDKLARYLIFTCCLLLWVSFGLAYSTDASSISGRFSDFGQVLGEWSVSSLIRAGDGKIYGGTHFAGHLFVFDPGSNSITDKGVAPGQGILALTWGLDGKLYGGGSLGYVWSFDTGNNSFSNRGQVPTGARIIGMTAGTDGLIYVGTEGGSSQNGRLFAFNPNNNSFTDKGTVANEGSMGYGLITGSDGNIYGGTIRRGHLFVYIPSSNTLVDKGQPIPGEQGVNSLVIGSDGKLYGGTQPNGHLFSYDLSSGSYSDKGQAVSGQPRVVSLTSFQNKIYGGTSYYAGSSGSAHLFAFDIGGQSYQDLGSPLQGQIGVETLVSAPGGLIYGGTRTTAHVFSYAATYQPVPDGYNFQNSARPLPSWDTFKQTFANSSLEYIGGIPKPGAWQFYQTIYRKAFEGLCDGMAATTAAYFENIQPRPNGATTTYALSANTAWPLIELFHGRQMSKGLETYRDNLWRNNPGVDGVYNQLKSHLPVTSGDPFVLSISPGPNNSLPANQQFGHALVPYRFEEQAGAWGKVYVYDSNFPADQNRYFYFNFQSSPHSFTYDLGFPEPPGSGSNYQVHSTDGWEITLTPLSQFTSYDAKVLHEGILGWLLGADNVVHTNGSGQVLGYVQGVMSNTIPGSAPVYPWLTPSFTGGTIGFSLPADNYQAMISSNGAYEYMISSPTSTLDIRVQPSGGSTVRSAASALATDYISLSSQDVSVFYSTTTPISQVLSLQLGGNQEGTPRNFGLLNATLGGSGYLSATNTSNSLFIQTSGIGSTFDLDVKGPDGNALGWFVHKAVPVSASSAITIEAPSLAASSVVTVSLSSNTGALQTQVLNNQVQKIYLPSIER